MRSGKYSLVILIVGFFLWFSPWVSWAQSISLDQKIGQMLLIGFDGDHLNQKDPVVSDILNERIGGVVLFDYNFQTKKFDKNIKSAEQLQSLMQELQSYAKEAAYNHGHPFSPLLIAVDYEGGYVNRLKEQYGFPHTKSAADLGNEPVGVAKYYAHEMAVTLAREHINLDFAPIVDLNLNVNSPAIGALGRSFSSRPEIVVSRSAIFSRLFKRYHVLCAYKHFPGHGSAHADSHTDFVDVTDTWHEEELIPYKHLLHRSFSCDFVMTAHIVNRKLDPDGYPATLSHRMLTDILRGELGFKGIIVTDDMQMKAITKRYGLKQALQLAINAGANMFVFGNQLEYDPSIAKKVIILVKQLIQEGKVDERAIDESYNKIILVKQKIITD